MTVQRTDVTTAFNAYADGVEADLLNEQNSAWLLQAKVTSLTAENDTLRSQINTLAHHLVIGASWGNNTSPSDGVEAAAGVPYDGERIYLGGIDSDIGKAASLIAAAGKAGRKIVVVSFKLPGTWADVAAGKYDAWADKLVSALSAAAVNANVTVHVAFHHEPENDGAPLNGGTEVGRNNWLAMQNHLKPKVKSAKNLLFGVILMGAHSMPGDSLYPLWNLDAAVPAGVDFVYFDLYQWFSVPDKQGKKRTGWSDVPKGIKVLADWCKAHGIALYGLAEWGINPTADADPRGANWMQEVVDALHANQCTMGLYFNALKTFSMVQGDSRWKKWVAVVKKEATGVSK